MTQLLRFSETLGHGKRNKNERVHILENASKKKNKKGKRIVISTPEYKRYRRR